MSVDLREEPWDAWAQREIERLATELAEARRRLANIQYCDRCGGSWVQDGFTGACPCHQFSALRAERDEARALLRQAEDELDAIREVTAFLARVEAHS